MMQQEQEHNGISTPNISFRADEESSPFSSFPSWSAKKLCSEGDGKQLHAPPQSKLHAYIYLPIFVDNINPIFGK